MQWERFFRHTFKRPTQLVSPGSSVFHYTNVNHPKNWGDIIGLSICNHFSPRPLAEISDPYAAGKLLAVGSVMAFSMPGDTVWGAGTISPKDLGCGGRQMNILAVRGPHTREVLVRAGMAVPKVFGDPAMLYPQIRPRSSGLDTSHRWGVIPHYCDVGHSVLEKWADEGALIIDICAGREEFISQLLSVDRIVSSSLHGLIMADAYEIPNARITLNNKLYGGDFKFNDYGASVSRGVIDSTRVNPGESLKTLDTLPLNDTCHFNSDRLLSAAPWNEF